jgi:hypothetical protein
LQLAQSDLDRGALDPSRLIKIRDTVIEFAADLPDQADREPVGEGSTDDAEAAAAVEGIPANRDYPDVPSLAKTDLAPEWRGDHPVLCIGGRSQLDEAAAVLFAQLCSAHGLTARVEGPEVLSTANIVRLETADVALICLCYLGTRNPAHMRYAVRRLRRKLPHAKIMVGCWTDDGGSAGQLREATNVDFFASSLREATLMCVASASGNTVPGLAGKDLVDKPLLVSA